MKSNVTDLTHLASSRIRVAVVSDTHGLIDPRISKLVSKCSMVIHAGDIGSATVLNELAPKKGIVIAVKGNNDTETIWDKAESYLLEFLPLVQQVRLPGGTISVEHGHKVRDTNRYHEELRSRHPDSKLIVFGHTHLRAIDRTQLPWVINPGAAGRVRTHGGPSCMVVEILDHVWNIQKYRFSQEPRLS